MTAIGVSAETAAAWDTQLWLLRTDPSGSIGASCTLDSALTLQVDDAPPSTRKDVSASVQVADAPFPVAAPHTLTGASLTLTPTYQCQ